MTWWSVPSRPAARGPPALVQADHDLAYNFALRIFLGFEERIRTGSKRSGNRPRIPAPGLSDASFRDPTEFVLRCGRSGLRVCEIPVAIAEIRGTRPRLEAPSLRREKPARASAGLRGKETSP